MKILLVMSKPFINHVKKILTSFVGVLGISSLIALPAFSQSNPANLTNTVNTSRSNLTQNGKLPGGNVTYPYGSRIDSSGIISTPRGERAIPSVRVNHGDGSTSYYYRDGSQITIDSNNIPPIGKPIRN